jgi:hypothetical protein
MVRSDCGVRALSMIMGEVRTATCGPSRWTSQQAFWRICHGSAREAGSRLIFSTSLVDPAGGGQA